MSHLALTQYAESIQSEQGTIPAIIDETSVVALLSTLLGISLESLADLSTENVHNIRVYSIPEEKKQFPIEHIRTIQSEITLAPYQGKDIFILKDIDTATIGTQNALLKILEECPPYAVILLVVTSPQSIIETIHSRTLLLYSSNTEVSLDKPTLTLLTEYTQGNPIGWISHLYQTEYSKEEAIQILAYVYPHIPHVKQSLCKQAISSLFRVHENPRNILDAFFLYS